MPVSRTELASEIQSNQEFAPCTLLHLESNEALLTRQMWDIIDRPKKAYRHRDYSFHYLRDLFVFVWVFLVEFDLQIDLLGGASKRFGCQAQNSLRNFVMLLN